MKKYWKIEQRYWKNQGKVREICQPENLGTMINVLVHENEETPGLSTGISFPQHSKYWPSCNSITQPQPNSNLCYNRDVCYSICDSHARVFLFRWPMPWR